MKRLTVLLSLLFILTLVPDVMAQAPTVTGATVSTTAPVTSTTTIETGTIAGQVLLWVTTTFGSIIGMALTAWIFKMFKLAGLQVSDTLRAKLQEIIVNGLNAGAKAEADNLHGKGSIEVKNNIIKYAVDYTQAHGAETLKALGEQPETAKAVEAIKARIETAIADPTVPTPAVLDNKSPTQPSSPLSLKPQGI